MIAELKPYSDYKESGLPWLDRLPGHWGVRRSKYLFREVDQRSAAGTETRLSMSQRHGLIPSSEIEERRLVSESNIGGKLCKPGDLVLNRLKAHLGVLALSPTHGLVSPDYTVLRPIGTANHRYFCAVYRSPYCGQELRQRAKGIVEGFWRLYTDDFYDIRVPVPPTAEQAAIVRFLGWANGRLERAIRAKRKVIALLMEQKQAIIQRAVTRGLDPAVTLKPSGIPWLGDIPQQWKIRRLKSLSQFVTSGSRGWARYYADAGSVFLRIGNISTTSVDLRLKRISYVTPPKDAEGERTRALPDDLLLSITAQIGAVGVVPEGLDEAFVNQHTALIRLRRAECVPRWVAYVLLSQFGKQQCRLLTNGGTKVGLTLDDVRCLSVLSPPVDEQRRIVDGLEDQTRELNVAIARMEHEIELLREYRDRLVADAVTGRFDVRQAAARLPEEPSLDIAEEPVGGTDDTELDDEEAAA